MPMPINRPQNGLNPGARPTPGNPPAWANRAAPTPPTPAAPPVPTRAARPTPPAAVAGAGEGQRPYIAPPTPGNIVGGYSGQMNMAPAVAGQGETPRMNIPMPPGRNTSG